MVLKEYKTNMISVVEYIALSVTFKANLFVAINTD